jgi:hypothetical protein
MTSDMADPQPVNGQGPTPTHAQDSGPSRMGEALRYGLRGWPVLPLHGIRDRKCTCPKGTACGSPGKHPRTNHGVTDATADLETIRLWWTTWPDANIGIATGAVSGIFVLDIDPEHGGDDSLDALIDEHGGLPDTVEVETGGGGRHIYFAYTGIGVVGNSVGRLAPGLDIRSDGGYVVAPPSRHVSGRNYEWEASSHPDDTALASPPRWLVDMLTETTNGSPRSDNREDGNRRVDPAAVLAGVPKGQRNDTLFKFASRHRGLGLDSEEALVLALTAAGAADPPLPHGEVAGIVDNVYSRYESDQATEAAASRRRVLVRTVADWFKDPPVEVEPIVTGLLLPGDQMIVGGARGAAKTWLAMAIALQLARGEGLILGRFPVVRPVKVLYCHGELPDDHSTYARWERLVASGDIPNTLLESYSRWRIRMVKERETYRDRETQTTYTTERTSAVIDPEFIETLRFIQPEVVVLDPYAVFYTGQEIDNTQIEAAVSELTALTDELGITWIIIHHFSQARQGVDPEDWWRGASRLADWASVRITLQPAYSVKDAKKQGMTRMEARRFANVRLLLRRQETPPDFGARFDPTTGFWVAWKSPTLTDQRRSDLPVNDLVKRLQAAGGRWESTNKASEDLGVSHAKAKELLNEAERAGLIESGEGPRRAVTWSLKESM